MELQKPNISHKEEYENLISSWWEVENLSEISPWALFDWSNFEEFLEINEKRVVWIWVTVPAQLFFLIDENVIIWAIDIRFNINNPFLLNYGWHIWYGISPDYRKKWYATKMLELGLIECRKLGLDKVLICCYTDNIWSYKTIERNWGILENITKWEWKQNSRYWIDIK